MAPLISSQVFVAWNDLKFWALLTPAPVLATLSQVQMSILELTSGENSDCEPQTHGTTQATLQTEYSIRFVLSKNCVLGVFLISPHKVVFYPNVAHIHKRANTSTGHTSSGEMSSYCKESFGSTSCFCRPLVAPHTRLSGRAWSRLRAASTEETNAPFCRLLFV